MAGSLGEAADRITRAPAMIAGGLVGGTLLAVGAPVVVAAGGGVAALAGVVGLGRFAVGARREPKQRAIRLVPEWERHVREATDSHRRYVEAVERVADPTLRESLEATGRRLEDGVAATRTIAERGQQLDEALASLPDPDELDGRLRRLRADGVGHDDPRWTSLALQRDTARRIATQRDEVVTRLDTLDAQIDAAVAHAIETGLSADAGRVRGLDAGIEAAVAELEALNAALTEVDES